MPELPEVETVRRSLAKKIKNRKIIDLKIVYQKVIEKSPLDIFLLKNQKIIDINRRGKWLIFVFDKYYLLSHLRMEGRYVFRGPDEPWEKHQHIGFLLDNNLELRYTDHRKFGRMLLIEKNELEKYLDKLGPEPENLDVAYLKAKYQKKNIAIKTALLDQTIFVGVGNIYADEILFLSKISPFKKASELTEKEIKALIKNTQLVLNAAVDSGGTTISTYMPEEGVKGRFQNSLKVHHRQNEVCLLCQTRIEKTKINGRGTYYCPKCQKK